MLLTFYADESFNDRCFCFGGWLAKENVWIGIGNQWKQRIAYERRKHVKHGNFRRYHATDCNGGYKEYENWSKPERDQHTKKLLSIIRRKRQHIQGICFGLDLKALNHHFPLPDGDLSGAYNLAVRRLLKLIHTVVAKGKGHKVTIIHSDAPGYNGKVREAFDKLVNDPALPHYRELFTTITPLHWKDCVQLQPADLIAFEGFKVIDGDLHSKAPKIRKSLEAIFGAGIEVIVRHFDEASIASLARKHKASLAV